MSNEAQLQEGAEVQGGAQGLQRALDPKPAHSSDISVMTTDENQGEAERHFCTRCQGPRTGHGFKNSQASLLNGVGLEGHGQGCSCPLTPSLHTN